MIVKNVLLLPTSKTIVRVNYVRVWNISMEKDAIHVHQG